MDSAITEEMDARLARQALLDVIDPELGINIVDLGLVYGLKVEGSVVWVRMTLTSPGCPMGAYLLQVAEEAIHQTLPEHNVHLDLVWDPPWSPERMSPAARRAMGWQEAP